jgi:hypothetical protein
MLLSIACVATMSCGGSGGDPAVVVAPNYAYSIPVDQGDGWETVALGDVGITESLGVYWTKSHRFGGLTGHDINLNKRRGDVGEEN